MPTIVSIGYIWNSIGIFGSALSLGSRASVKVILEVIPKLFKLLICSEKMKASTVEFDWESSSFVFTKSGLIFYPTIIAAPWDFNPLT